MGIRAKLKQRKIKFGDDYVLREAMRVTGCTIEVAKERLDRLLQSKLAGRLRAKECGPEDTTFMFIVDKYMCGEVTNDDELLTIVYSMRTPPSPKPNPRA